jgi:hypothetical protein
VPRCDKFVLLRVLGHFLLSKVPDEGLSETCEALTEFYDYYTDLAQKRISAVQPANRTFDATLSASYVRTPFVIPEE